MRKIALNSGIMFISLLIIFTACKKDENNDTNTPTKSTQEYLTAGFWKFTAITVDPGISYGGTTITDFFSQQDPCTKDDIMRFNSDGTITDDEGATKCDPNDPQTSNDGSWVLSTDNKVLTISYPEEAPISLTITSINSTTLTGNYSMTENFGGGDVTYTFTVTLVRQ